MSESDSSGFDSYRERSSPSPSPSSSDDHHHHHHRESRGRSHRRRRRSRPRISLYWDRAPPGYEHLTPRQYKAMQASGQISGGAVSCSSSGAAVASHISRQSRRLFVGNIPLAISDAEIIQFFNQQMHVNGLSQAGGDPVLSCQINVEKNYAFIEFRSVDECSQGMAFDGIVLRGQSLKIRRPHDYQPVVPEGDGSLVDPVLGDVVKTQYVSTVVRDSPYKLFIGAIPVYLTEEQTKELLVPFGHLRSFHLARDTATGLSRGYAFCEYINPQVTEQAIAALNGMTLGGRQLIVQLASVGAKGGAGKRWLSAPVSIQVPGLDVNLQEVEETATEVLSLLNMVTPDDLRDDEEYEDIMEDIRTECSRFGLVRSIEIPRPIDGVEVPGVGKVFVEFTQVSECQQAVKYLAGRKFCGRVVVTSYIALERYQRRDF